MKNSSFKVVGIILAIILAIAIMPSFVKAAEINTNAVILEKASGEKIIYIKDLNSTEFKYAFSDSQDDSSLVYKTCLTDSNGEKVASLESGKTYKYMFITEEEKTSVIELDSLKSITEEEISNVEQLTKIISVKTDESKSESSTAEDGTTITKTRGKIVITEEGDYKYQYQLIEILDTNGSTETLNQTAVELYDELVVLENAETMYDKLVAEITIRDDYAELLENATWTDVKDMEILQPENSQKGEKFIVLIQKLQAGNVVESDIQFMTCDRADDADVEYTNTTITKTIEKKTALPITGENLALYIILAVIIVAIVIVAIRMRYLKGKENGKL